MARLIPERNGSSRSFFWHLPSACGTVFRRQPHFWFVRARRRKSQTGDIADMTCDSLCLLQWFPKLGHSIEEFHPTVRLPGRGVQSRLANPEDTFVRRRSTVRSQAIFHLGYLLVDSRTISLGRSTTCSISEDARSGSSSFFRIT